MLHFSRWKIFASLAACLGLLSAALPNVLSDGVRSSLPSFMPSAVLHLGLDLQGGSHVLLEVDKDDMRRHLLSQLKGDVRQSLRDARIGYSGLRTTDDSARFRLRDASDASAAREALDGVFSSVSSPLPFGSGLDGSPLETVSVEIDSDGEAVASLTEEGFSDRVRKAVRQSIEIVRRRVDALGTTEPIIQRQGADRILVQVPGLDDPKRLKEILGRTAKLSLRLLCDRQPSGDVSSYRAEGDCEVFPGREGASASWYALRSASRYTVDGENLTDANPGFTQYGNQPAVFFSLNSSGARKFGRITRDNVGKPFAILLDGEVISAPTIQSPIMQGSAQITGQFTVAETDDLALVLRSGALPAKLVILEERTVGPSLGADSIRGWEGCGDYRLDSCGGFHIAFVRSFRDCSERGVGDKCGSDCGRFIVISGDVDVARDRGHRFDDGDGCRRERSDI